MNKTCFIIAAAGTGKRMKSYGAKSLLALKDGRSLIRKQIDTIKLCQTKPEIITVLGFDIEKIAKTLPLGIRVIENENYNDTGVARSIAMGLRATTASRCIVIYGDILFNKATIEKLPNESCLIIDKSNKAPKSEIGVIMENDHAVHLDFGLPNQWCYIIQLMGKELELFKIISHNHDKRKLSGHEIINEIIDKGGSFKCFEPKKMKIVEIDCTKDLLKC